MTLNINQKLNAEQQAEFFRFVEFGTKWIKGEMSFDEIKEQIGIPQYTSDQNGRIQYLYFPHKLMELSFWFNHPKVGSDQIIIDAFSIKLNDEVQTNIPYEIFDKFEFRRKVRGERLDGERVEESDFVSFPHFLDISSSTPINTVDFCYRLPLPGKLPYDVNIGIEYLAELVSEKGPWNLDNVRTAVNLRELDIFRHYLNEKEFKQQGEASHEK
ncbi:hypothetical protein [Paraburkholderia sp. J67]|uniref:hypothetical protein n=1 Tax=Paraburkholderia sp. J67 TaxID=2805435 RepID=UPI002ABD8196|nr:hypothetical protein [Paraburkholderia sp. J67]